MLSAMAVLISRDRYLAGHSFPSIMVTKAESAGQLEVLSPSLLLQ